MILENDLVEDLKVTKVKLETLYAVLSDRVDTYTAAIIEDAVEVIDATIEYLEDE